LAQSFRPLTYYSRPRTNSPNQMTLRCGEWGRGLASELRPMLHDRLAFGADAPAGLRPRIEDRSPATDLFAAFVVLLKA